MQKWIEVAGMSLRMRRDSERSFLESGKSTQRRCQHLIERVEQEIRVLSAECHRRTNLERVAGTAETPKHDSPVAHLVDDTTCEIGCRFLCFAIEHELCPEYQARATRISDDLVFQSQIIQSLPGKFSDPSSIFEQPLFLDLIQYGHCRGTRNRVPSKRVEVAILRLERRQQGTSSNHCPDGMAVGHRLSQRNDVGLNPLAQVPPHVRANPTEARLDFVGNDDPSGFSDLLNCRLQPPFWKVGKTLIHKKWAKYRCRKTVT